MTRLGVATCALLAFTAGYAFPFERVSWGQELVLIVLLYLSWRGVYDIELHHKARCKILAEQTKKDTPTR